MSEDSTNRRSVLKSLAALPAAALLAGPSLAQAATGKIIVFNGTALRGAGKIVVRAFGWAAETENGWRLGP